MDADTIDARSPLFTRAPEPEAMSRRLRVAIVTESFLPQLNGVTNSVRHVVDHLVSHGHVALVVAPGPGRADYRGVPVIRTRSIATPRYKSFPVGLPDQAVEQALAEFRPDVVHLASPIALGAVGLRAARRLGVPTVAVYQTDIPGFMRRYGIPGEASVARWVARIHRRADRTLVPSTAAQAQLQSVGVQNLHRWGRGVDLDLFGPDNRVSALHDHWARAGRKDGDRVVVGYVGRLAPEKQVRRLREVVDLPGARLVVVGDGPEKDWLHRKMPDAVFTGMLSGVELARAYASLDVFVHTGESETFCQTIQEAQASGVPVVAPAAGGPLDLIESGVTGVLFDPADPTSLRDSVAELVRSADVRADLAARGLRRVATRGWDGVIQELVELHYEAVLADSGDRAAA